MADIQHNVITDPDIHEPKGAASALANTVYVANGAGSGSWDAISYPVVAENLLSGRSYATQGPTATDVSHQIEFGTGVSTSEMSLDAAGNLTVLTAGTYEIIFVFRLGRTSAAGSALMGVRWLINGVTAGGPTAIRLADGSFTVPFSFTTLKEFSAGDVITAEIIRDSSGVNNGSLIPANFVSTDWPDAASAVIIVNKLRAEL